MSLLPRRTKISFVAPANGQALPVTRWSVEAVDNELGFDNSYAVVHRRQHRPVLLSTHDSAAAALAFTQAVEHADEALLKRAAVRLVRHDGDQSLAVANMDREHGSSVVERLYINEGDQALPSGLADQIQSALGTRNRMATRRFTGPVEASALAGVQ